MKAIMAMAKNRAIGLNNQLPWGTIYKEDFQWFKEFTMGKTLIVGWYTFNSLPRLKGRKGVVLNKMWDGNIMYDIQNAPFDSFRMHNPDPVWNGFEYTDDGFNPDKYQDAIVAGGKKTYTFLMPHITEFYFTHIDKEYVGDTFMEPFEHFFSKHEVVKEFDFGKVICYTKNNE